MEPRLKPGEWIDDRPDADLDGWTEMVDALLDAKEGDDRECL